jgi:ferrochelatase
MVGAERKGEIGEEGGRGLAVLLLAYGGPDKLDDIPEYLSDVRGGRPTSPELVEEIRRRYQLIGGRSPLLERTREQAAALERRLGDRWRASVGMRHWKPRIADALSELGRSGIGRVVALPMAPHYSSMSVGAYRRACEAAPAVARGEVSLGCVEGWSAHHGYQAAVAEKVGAALAVLERDVRERTLVVFTAHSLPERILAGGDAYPAHVRDSAAAVAGRLGLTSWRFAFQSAGATSEPWLMPDAGEVIRDAQREGFRHALLAPFGFVADNVEILYDVDVVYREQAAEVGIGFSRTESLNASPAFIDALADLALDTARKAGWT